MRDINVIVISSNGSDNHNDDNLDYLLNKFEYKYKTIQHHFYIKLDGTIIQLKDVDIRVFFVKKRSNDSISICMAGTGKKGFSEAQLYSLRKIFHSLRDKYKCDNLQAIQDFNKDDFINLDIKGYRKYFNV